MPFIGAAIGAIGAALGAVGSFVTGLGIFGKIAIGIGLNVASAYLQKALAKKNAPQQIGGVQIDRQYGADVSRQVGCGLVGVAAHDVYVNTHGNSNKFLQQIYTLSDYYSHGLSRVAINGEWVTLGTTPDPQKGLPVTSGEFANLIWIKFRDGTQTVADAGLVAGSNPSGRWTSAHRGIGITDVIVSMTYHKDKNNAFPDFFFEYYGARFYDWRKDSTVGGSGSHRWNDVSTHEFTENPIVIEYNYRRGLRVNGDLFCGMEMLPNDLPLAKWTAAANICDETTSDGARYRVSVILDCMATHGDNIESLMMSCGGMTIDDVDGSWPLVGSDQPVVATIYDDDLASDSPRQFRARRSMGDLVNAVTGTSPDPDALWAMTEYEGQISTAAVAVDRRTRDVPIDFPMVRSKRQAGQLAGIYLEENRWEATASETYRPRWQGLKAGDWVRRISPRFAPRTSRIFMVTEASLASLDSEAPRNVQVSLQERDGSIYDGITAPVIVYPFPPGQPQYANEVQNFVLSAIVVEGTNGLKPAIHARWDAFTDETVEGVDIRYWPASQAETVMAHPTVPDDVTIAVIADGTVSKTEFSVQTRLVTRPRRTVPWSQVYKITTLDQPISDIRVYLAKLGEEVREYLQGRQREFDETFQRLEYLAANVGTGNIEDIVSSQKFIKEIGRNAASILRESQLRVTADEALATDLTVVQTNVEDNAAAIIAEATARSTADGALATDINVVRATADNAAAAVVTEATTRASADNALSSAITAVSAVADAGTAQGLLGWQAVSAPGGVSARFRLEGKATAGGVSRFAGMYLDVLPTSSRLTYLADQFIITNGAVNGTPFVYEGSVLKLGLANIGDITAGILRSTDNKFVLNLTNKTMIWSD